MSERQFIVTDRVKLDYPTYIALSGATYNEENLREWANDRWGTPKDAALSVIARDIKHGGWMMFEYVAPADPDPEHAEKEKNSGHATTVSSGRLAKARMHTNKEE